MDIFFENLITPFLDLTNKATDNITIFSPYVKKSLVDAFYESKPAGVSFSLITKINVQDLLLGASDLEALGEVINRGDIVFINNRIHLKTYLFDFKRLLSGSANFTKKGLGLAGNSNLETLFLTTPSQDYLSYLNRIISSAEVLGKSDYELLKLKLKKLKEETSLPNNLDEINESFNSGLFMNKALMASRLPQTPQLIDLYNYLQKSKDTKFEEQIKHDLAVFNLDPKSDYPASFDDFKVFFRPIFLSHEFISEILNQANPSINFGTARRIIENKCIDNPRPGKTEVNILMNNIFNWLEELQGESYEIKQPNHTKIIYKRNEK